MAFLLSGFYYFYFSVIGIYIIFLPKVLADVGYSASEIGIIFAASPLVRLVLPFLFMRGFTLNKTMFNRALVIIILSSISFYFSLEHFYALLLSNIFMGIGMSLTLPYIETLSLEVLGKERYGKVRLFGSLGFILVALVLVKFVASAYNALYFLASLSFVTTLFAFLIANNVEKQTSFTSHNTQVSDISLLKDYKLWIGLTLMQMSFGSFYNFFTIYETSHGISLDMTIYLWSFGVVVEIVMLFFQGKLLQRNLLSILEFTIFATVIRWFLVFMFPQNIIVLFFAQSLHALSFALFHSAAISYLHQVYKNKTLSQQFFSGITYGFGGLSGALIAGYVYEWYPKYLFLSSSLIACCALVFIFLYNTQQKAKEA